MSTIIGTTANITQTAIYNAYGCSVSSTGLGYNVAFGPQTTVATTLPIPLPWQIGVPTANQVITYTSIFTTQTFTSPVFAASNALPIVLQLASNAGLVIGTVLTVSGVLGNTAANGVWSVSALGAGQLVTLQGSAGNAAYLSGGVASAAAIPVTMLVPSISVADCSMPSLFWTALAAAQLGSGLDMKTATLLGWVAFWDYTRQGGT